MTTELTDEVWGRLDSARAGLTPPVRRGVVTAALALLLLAVAFQAMVSAGEFTPRLHASHWTIATPALEVHRVDVRVTIVNDAWSEEVITRVDAGLPGVEVGLPAATGGVPARSSRTITLFFFARHCPATSDGNFLLGPRLTLERFWGDTHTRIDLDTISDGDRTLAHPYADGLVALACGLAT